MLQSVVHEVIGDKINVTVVFNCNDVLKFTHERYEHHLEELNEVLPLLAKVKATIELGKMKLAKLMERLSLVWAGQSGQFLKSHKNIRSATNFKELSCLNGTKVEQSTIGT